MFKSLVQKIFPSFVSFPIKPNYETFEQTRNLTEHDKESLKNDLLQQVSSHSLMIKTPLQSPFEKHQEDFLNFLFGETTSAKQKDPLSEYVTEHIHELLLTPQNLVNELPIMPESVNKIIMSLKDDEFNINQLLAIIASEPSMAVDTIRLANSVKYNHSRKEIIDLKKAFMCMGAKGLTEGVLAVFINKFTPSSTIYFKTFGTKIWQHCEQTAIIAKQLAENNLSDEESEAAYLIGLLRNIGEMVIFQLMIEAFRHVDPDALPSSYAFKQLMSTHSISLTLAIVKKWSLPPIVINAIEQQQSVTTMSPLAICINDANIICSMVSLLEKNRINEDDYKQRCDDLLKSQNAQHLAQQYMSESLV